MNEQEQLIDGLMKVLFLFANSDGTWFERYWPQYGITAEQEDLIKQHYKEWYQTNIENKG